MTGQPESKRLSKTFELKAGPMPALKRAAAPQAVEPGAPDGRNAGQPDEMPMPKFLSQREVLLRLVETLKAL
jgi:hypothetical protein